MGNLQASPSNEQSTEYARLISAVALGRDRDAFAQLFNSLAPKVKSYMMRKGVAPDLAEDLAVETFVKLWTRAATFDPDQGSASAWIYTIDRNTYVDGYRRDRPAANFIHLMGDALGPVTPEDAYLSAEREQRLRSALHQLPTTEAQLLRMSYFHDSPHGEIARVLGLPLGTVKSRLRRALKRLRAVLVSATEPSANMTSDLPCNNRTFRTSA
uniref:Sigma-70 family RNA polymerase sigma factor n=1 Tax=Phenylobacterium glaciei TaxID=2803784 RepID=A0A974SAX0_9CAUL|nr:sigma-70 family RNA polymerase sigma factor [Phenylobacterium glaciei]